MAKGPNQQRNAGSRGGGKPSGGRGKGGRAQAGRVQAGRSQRRGDKQDARGGSQSRSRKAAGGAGAARSDLIEGRRAAEEALFSGMPLKSALVAAGAGQTDPALDRIVAKLEERGVAIEYVPRTRLDQLSSHGTHQGIIVRAKPFEYASVGDVINNAGTGDALVIVLDHVTDEGNFGAIVRTAECVGAAGVVIANARAAKVGVGAYKTSTGAVLHVPIAQVPNLASALDRLKEAGFWVCASTEHAKDDVWGAPMGGRLALVMGSEGSGISRLVLEKCDFAAKLPQRGRIESLNVAQATTVMAYEWLRRVSQGG
ncbi:23S rRNA (guanosine(2251)-2'-O)-methyltransferase RlmB [Paratractidigestivibacter sp.]|uniref:23S rRNA (guanosine(2251)-2'-O)-methyltransferase RlmB n=1 Tax=Paratractidigestivibacter sp. TaxID=2847316 RepID=UPI002ABE020C|nr:23S rRNA (guanosine(2251)-2'-O)-methyltransferase RlmB [Paratractidigestivibacter sp.]